MRISILFMSLSGDSGGEEDFYMLSIPLVGHRIERNGLTYRVDEVWWRLEHNTEGRLDSLVPLVIAERYEL